MATRTRKPAGNFLHLEAADVASAELLLGIPSFVRPNRSKGAKARGVRYEKQVQKQFASQYPHYVASPWFKYSLRSTPSRVNYAQPDGLLIDPLSGLVTIVEIKYAHTADAYFQLYDKYLPIVQRFMRFAHWRFALCEVVRWYDAHTDFPTDVTLVDDIEVAKATGFSVHICRP